MISFATSLKIQLSKMETLSEAHSTPVSRAFLKIGLPWLDPFSSSAWYPICIKMYQGDRPRHPVHLVGSLDDASHQLLLSLLNLSQQENRRKMMRRSEAQVYHGVKTWSSCAAFSACRFRKTSWTKTDQNNRKENAKAKAWSIEKFQAVPRKNDKKRLEVLNGSAAVCRLPFV